MKLPTKSPMALIVVSTFLLGPIPAAAGTRRIAPSPPGPAAPFPGPPAFKHRAFYLHCGWAFDHPFAPRSWSRADYDGVFKLLKRLGFDTVMYWPQIEAMPAPLSPQDAGELAEIRDIVEDARTAGLDCWMAMTPNLMSPAALAARPFRERNPYKHYLTMHLDDPKQADAYLAHRSAMLRIVNNADAYVTIDGDPGGYAGAKPEDWLRVFQSDREALDSHGTHPRRQMVIPWVWAGWGARVPVWQDDPTPFSRAAISLFKRRLPEPWLMLPGRCHKDGWGNGRINLALAEELGVLDRSMILCYEAIEFEPTSPASVLQFDLIRRILKQESRLAPLTYGVMGNAQQPIMRLPNIYFFARACWDLAYLDRSDDEVLKDCADFLGGPRDDLALAWQCLALPLERLPRDLPHRLRRGRLTAEAASFLPGGAARYMEILAAQTASRIGLLEAVQKPAADDAECARRIADGTAALAAWWATHHYVMDGDPGTSFSWDFVRGDQSMLLADWASRNARNRAAVIPAAVNHLVESHVLDKDVADAAVQGLFQMADSARR
jgi:hypothetical protein